MNRILWAFTEFYLVLLSYSSRYARSGMLVSVNWIWIFVGGFTEFLPGFLCFHLLFCCFSEFLLIVNVLTELYSIWDDIAWFFVSIMKLTSFGRFFIAIH